MFNARVPPLVGLDCGGITKQKSSRIDLFFKQSLGLFTVLSKEHGVFSSLPLASDVVLEIGLGSWTGLHFLLGLVLVLDKEDSGLC